MSVKPIPEGYHSITPYLIVVGAAQLIDFMKAAFDAKEIERMQDSDGMIRHAEVKIGDSIIMLAEASEKFKAMPSSMYLYVPDTDEVYNRAMKSGATSTMEPVDQFYGDRNAGVTDPSGNIWWIATRKEDLSPEELQKRATAQMK